VHCTQAAEAYHKVCMKLPAHRVRHLDETTTTTSMLNYLKNKTLFDTMIMDLPTRRTVRTNDRRPGLQMLLSCTMGTNFRSPATQKTFMHPDLRLTRHEILDLLCGRFLLPKNRASYVLLEKLEFSFGQKLVTQDGHVYWACNSVQGGRRDVLCLKGHETVTIQSREVNNDLCCESVCFLALGGVRAFLSGETISPECLKEVAGRIHQDTLTFVIGRWFGPHPLVIERDDKFRPVCPGELHINHCLRSYSVTSTDRRSLFTRGGECAVQAHQFRIFGKTIQEQRACMDNERRAYYCLVFPDTIVNTASMCTLFLPGTSQPDLSRWLQTVTLV